MHSNSGSLLNIAINIIESDTNIITESREGTSIVIYSNSLPMQETITKLRKFREILLLACSSDI